MSHSTNDSGAQVADHSRRRSAYGLGLILLLALAITACGTSAAQESRIPHESETLSSAPSTSPSPTRTWTTVVLNGTESQTQIEVTVTDVKVNAENTDALHEVGHGNRLAAVKLRIDNTGTNTYLDAPDNGVLATDAQGKSYGSALVMTIASGETFLATGVDLAPGESVEGWIVFEVPRDAQLTHVEFTADSGEGETGTWEL
jgi:hypothetical protein